MCVSYLQSFHATLLCGNNTEPFTSHLSAVSLLFCMYWTRYDRNELRISFLVFAVKMVVSYWFSLSLKEWFWTPVASCKHRDHHDPTSIVYIFHITLAFVPPGTYSASKNTSPGAKYPLADLSACMCLITLENYCLLLVCPPEGDFFMLTSCGQSCGFPYVLLGLHISETCLTLFWTSSLALTFINTLTNI